MKSKYPRRKSRRKPPLLSKEERTIIILGGAPSCLSCEGTGYFVYPRQLEENEVCLNCLGAGHVLPRSSMKAYAKARLRLIRYYQKQNPGYNWRTNADDWERERIPEPKSDEC